MTTLTSSIPEVLDSTTGGRIVVGYDGSESSVGAAAWAAAEAVLRNAPLSIVSCASMPVSAGWMAGSAVVVEGEFTALECAAEESAETIAVQLRRLHPTLRCAVDVHVGAPRDVLVEVSRRAALLVVGKTGAGAIKTLLLGSVANAVIRRSACPCVLVPSCAVPHHHPDDGVARSRIVVGIDGSAPSDAALAWAIEEAAVRECELLVVQAWSYEYPGPVLESREAHDAAAAAASQTLDAAVATALARRPEVQVSGRLVEARPLSALLDHVNSVDLLVIGSRGRGGLRSMLFGSIASAVTEHAPCPTVVVHSTLS